MTHSGRPDTPESVGVGKVSMERKDLRGRIEELCLLQTGGPFILSTGQESSFYFDCKRAVLQGEVLSAIAELLLHEADALPQRPTAVGGLSIGADFLVAAVIQLAARRGHPMVNGCVVRKDRKQHGTQNYIENEQPAGTRVMVVDDVFTTGSSTLRACDRLKEAGNEIVGIVGLIDREQGGIDNLRSKYDVPVTTLFKSSQFPGLVKHLERDSRPLAATA